MKINEFINESTTAGSIATVAAPMTTQKRSGVGKGVYGNERAGNLLTGKKTSKKYANSVGENTSDKSSSESLAESIAPISEAPVLADKQSCIRYFVSRGKTPAQGAAAWERGYRGGPTSKQIKKNQEPASTSVASSTPFKSPVHRMDEIAYDLEHMQNGNFKQKYGKTKDQIISALGHPMRTNELNEDDFIIVPGQGHKLKSGFVPRDQDRRDHEVEMARGELFQTYKNAKKINELIKDISEDQGLPAWVQSKITKACDYLTSVRQYLEGNTIHETGGVIAAGGVNENEGSEELQKGKTAYLKTRTVPNAPASGKIEKIGDTHVILKCVNGRFKAKKDNVTLDRTKSYIYKDSNNNE